MKLFTKIALVSAMALSANAMAAQLQALDDAALSATTGQDGITLTIKSEGIKIDKLLIHDNDGLDSTKTYNQTTSNPTYSSELAAAKTAYDAAVSAASGDLNDPAVIAAKSTLDGVSPIVSTAKNFGGTDTAGAIILNGVEVKLTGDTVVKLDTDAGDDGAGGTAPFLNVGLQTGTKTQIFVDNIAVGASGTYDAAVSNRRGATNEVTILSGYDANHKIDITLGQTTMNIQLGNAPQGAMIVASGTVANGIEIGNLAIVDSSVNGGGGIGIDRIRITDANSNGLTADARINATNAGLSITTAGTKKDIYMDAVRLGNVSGMVGGVNAMTKSIGAVEIQGLDMRTSTILVSGH